MLKNNNNRTFDFCYNGFEMHESKNRDRFNYSYTSIEE